MYSDELSTIMRTALQPIVRFRQFCDAKDATDKGLNKGELFTWNIYSDVATQGGKLVEQQVMPETNFTISQGSLTVDEYGNSVPYTGKLNNLSKQPVVEIIHKVLKNDAKKAMDSAAHAQFDRTSLRVLPGDGGATASVATAIQVITNGDTGLAVGGDKINDVAYGRDHAKLICDTMKERSIPAYTGDDYYAVGWPSTFRNLKNNLEDVHKYIEPGWQRIMNGEIGRYENTRYIEQTNVAKEVWSTGKSNWIYFFGEDTVAEAICIPEEIRGKIPTDFGRSRGIAWYYLGGFGIVHSGDNNAQTRIMKWDSLS
jgi:N4-gp56 family major capsid protein